MLICCCMLWKRKEYDVFPDYIGNQQEVNPRFANYAKIKDNVVVVPVKDFIYEKGFLPDPNKKRRKKRNDGELYVYVGDIHFLFSCYKLLLCLIFSN